VDALRPLRVVDRRLFDRVAFARTPSERGVSEAPWRRFSFGDLARLSWPFPLCENMAGGFTPDVAHARPHERR